MAQKTYYVIKESGEQERFNMSKLKKSLAHAGASNEVIAHIIKQMEQDQPFTTARDIYKAAYKYLRKQNIGVAGRYNLKKALFELGPSGYPFEQFVSELFKHQGYKVFLNETLQGACITHEVDCVAEKEEKRSLIECKFHNSAGMKSNVKIPLYVKARFDDIAAYEQQASVKEKCRNAWVVTNTKFTSDAIAFAECSGMKYMDWGKPNKASVSWLIDTLHLHPVTCLSSLTKHHKKFLIKNGVVMCHQLIKRESLLKRLRLDGMRIKKALQEAEAICNVDKK